MRHNAIQEKSFSFAHSIICLYMRLTEQREYVLSRQLLRSGTSIGANVEEAQAAQSSRDFLTKMCIAAKEARETHYWLRLLATSQLVSINVEQELKQSEELMRLLTAIVKTASLKR